MTCKALPEKQSEITFTIKNASSERTGDSRAYQSFTKTVAIEHLAIKNIFFIPEGEMTETKGRLVLFCRGMPKDTILAGATSCLLAFEYEDKTPADTAITLELKAQSVHLLNSMMNPVFNTAPVLSMNLINNMLPEADKRFEPVGQF